MRSFFRVAAVAAVALSLCGPAFAKGDDLSPADLAALKNYTLSMDKVKGMQAAMDEAKKTGATKQMKTVGDDSKSLAEMEAKINAMPGAMAIFKKHGLSAHDVAVMPFVLMDAGMAVQYPSAAAKLSDRMSPAQVAFFKQHQTELKSMTWLYGDGGQ